MFGNTLKDLRTAIIAFVLFSALLRSRYPFAITGIAQGLFHRQANGSLITVNGQTVGSSLVGQNFNSPVVLPPATVRRGHGRVRRAAHRPARTSGLQA